MTNIENSICQYQNCQRIANYRKLKVGNCHLKDTKYEFCGYHRPRNSINKKFPYKSIFDKINIELKYYNHQNEHIVYEYNDYIHKLLKNHKFKFPIKITAFTENIVFDIDYSYVDLGTNISHITNYKKYFNKDVVTKKDIYNVIREFQKYYNQKKLKCYIFIWIKNMTFMISLKNLDNITKKKMFMILYKNLKNIINRKKLNLIIYLNFL